MATPGINLVETRWANVPLPSDPQPDLATIVYKVFRCSLGHGDELPNGFEFTPAVGGDLSSLLIADRVLHLPDRLPFALLAAALLCPANAGQVTGGGYFISLGREEFTINAWWGREEEFRPIADRYNTTRVTLAGLGDWSPAEGTPPAS